MTSAGPVAQEGSNAVTSSVSTNCAGLIDIRALASSDGECEGTPTSRRRKTLYIATIVGCRLMAGALVVGLLACSSVKVDVNKVTEPSTPPSAAALAPTPTATTPPPADTSGTAVGSGAKEITPGAGTEGAGGGSKWAVGTKDGTGANTGGTSSTGDVSPAQPAQPKSLADATENCVLPPRERKRTLERRGPPPGKVEPHRLTAARLRWSSAM